MLLFTGGWWFEECLQPIFEDPAKFEAIETFTIVTGYGKSRTRGRRHGNDGMKKRVQAMLGFMGIEETPQENAGRVRVNKDSLREAVNKNNGRILLDVEGYMAWSKFFCSLGNRYVTFSLSDACNGYL